MSPAIAPIKNMLVKSAALHVTIGITSGLIAGNYFWYGIRMPAVRTRDEYYINLQKEREARVGA